jgi:hypothetical protein
MDGRSWFNGGNCMGHSRPSGSLHGFHQTLLHLPPTGPKRHLRQPSLRQPHTYRCHDRRGIHNPYSLSVLSPHHYIPAPLRASPSHAEPSSGPLSPWTILTAKPCHRHPLFNMGIAQLRRTRSLRLLYFPTLSPPLSLPYTTTSPPRARPLSDHRRGSDRLKLTTPTRRNGASEQSDRVCKNLKLDPMMHHCPPPCEPNASIEKREYWSDPEMSVPNSAPSRFLPPTLPSHTDHRFESSHVNPPGRHHAGRPPPRH